METRGQQKYSHSFLLSKTVMLNPGGDFDYEAAEKYFRQKQLSTRYSCDYGKNNASIKAPPNLFQYKQVKDLEYAEWLEPLAVKFIDIWIGLHDTENQELLLDALRSLNARYRANLTQEGEYRAEYNTRKKDWDLSKPTDVTLFTKKTVQKEKDYNAEFKQQLKRNHMMDEVNKMISDENDMMNSK